MSSVLQILKLAAAVPPAPAPAPAAPPQEPPPMKIVGSAFPSQPLPAATNGGFITQHKGLGDKSINPEEQQAQMQAQNEQQVAGIQGQLDQTSEMQKKTQKYLDDTTNTMIKSWEERLGGGKKMASSSPAFNPLNPRSPTGALAAPPTSLPGPLADDNPLKGIYDMGKRFITSRLSASYAPKPLGMFGDGYTRFGDKYIGAAPQVARWAEKEVPGMALLANFAGSLASKYLAPGSDYSAVGTDANRVAGQIRQSIS